VRRFSTSWIPCQGPLGATVARIVALTVPESRRAPSCASGPREIMATLPTSLDKAFEAHVAPVREALAALLDAFDQLRDEWGSLPAADSPAMAELATGAQFKGSSTWGDPVHAAHNLGQLLLFALGDCASSLVRVLSPGATPVYAHVVLARASLELASRAWWLFEPAIGVRLRAARGMNERIFGLSQQSRLPLSDQDRARSSERLDELFADAARLRFQTVGRRPTSVRYLEEMRPGQTQLIKKLLSADGDSSLGAFIYGVLSAVAHGMTFGLTSSVKADPTNPAKPPGVTWGAVYTDSLDVVHVLTAVILGTRAAHGRQNELFGWASESWSAAAADAVQAVRRSLPDAKTT
jgi:hypothetical protein